MPRILGKKVRVRHQEQRALFDLDFTPQPRQSLQVFVNGTRYGEGGYSLDGRTITLVMPVRRSDTVLVDYRY